MGLNENGGNEELKEPFSQKWRQFQIREEICENFFKTFVSRFDHKFVLSLAANCGDGGGGGWCCWMDSLSVGFGAGGGGAPRGRLCRGFGIGIRATPGDDGLPDLDAALPLRRNATPICLGGSRVMPRKKSSISMKSMLVLPWKYQSTSEIKLSTMSLIMFVC